MIHNVGPIADPCIILCVIESNSEKVPSAAFVACVPTVRKCTIQFKIYAGRPRVLSLARTKALHQKAT